MLWDDTFEALPGDLSIAKDTGDDQIRLTKVGISDRLELEHNFKAGTSPYHKAGKCSVMYVGDTLAISQLDCRVKGSISYDTDLEAIKVFDGSSWIVISDEHADLSGLLDDDHTQYLHLNKAAQELKKSLYITPGKKIGGKYIAGDFGRVSGFVYRYSAEVSVEFDNTDHEIRRTTGDFLADGFVAGDVIYTTSATNPGPFHVIAVTASILTLDAADTLTDETVDIIILVFSRGFHADETTLNFNYTYQAVCDCIIYVIPTAAGSGYSGTATANLLISGAYSGYPYWFPVKRGHYWKVTGSGTIYRMVIR
jgi:hypothetical protein